MADDSKYANGDDLANEQNCFYVIKQDDTYHPFSFLNIQESQLEILSFQIRIMQMQFCLDFLFREMES